jgi:hypothetical protein
VLLFKKSLAWWTLEVPEEKTKKVRLCRVLLPGFDRSLGLTRERPFSFV